MKTTRFAYALVLWVALTRCGLADTLLQQSEKAVAAGQYKAADGLITVWLKDHPRDVHGLCLKCQALEGEHQWAAALGTARQAVAVDPHDARAQHALGVAILPFMTEMLYTQHLDEAQKLTDEAAGPSGHICRGLMAYEKGWSQGTVDVSASHQEVQAALALDPQDPLSAGLLAYMDSNFSTALIRFQAAARQSQAPYVDLWTGRTLSHLYRGDEADAALKRAMGGWHAPSATILYLQSELATAGNHDALPLLQQALGLAPGLVPAWLAEGRLKLEAGETAAAVSAFQQALAHGAPPDPLALQVAVVQRLMGRLDDARQTLTQASQVTGDPAFSASVALEQALDAMLLDQTPDYAGLQQVSASVPEVQKPKLQVLLGWDALNRSDYQPARDMLRGGLAYAEADAPDVNVLTYLGLASIKMAAVDPQRLGHERIQAITLYAKAWQNVLQGSPMQKHIEQAFSAARNGEIAAIHQAIDNNLAVMSQIGNHNSADRLKLELEERLSQAEGLTLGTPGTLRGDVQAGDSNNR